MTARKLLKKRRSTNTDTNGLNKKIKTYPELLSNEYKKQKPETNAKQKQKQGNFLSSLFRNIQKKKSRKDNCFVFLFEKQLCSILMGSFAFT